MFCYKVGNWHNSSIFCRSISNKELYDAIIAAIDDLSWKHPKHLSDSIFDIIGKKDAFMSAMVLGKKDFGSVIECEDVYVGMIYLAPGTTYPTHAHDAIEMYHTITGTALWGPSMRHLKPIEPNNFVLHPSALPHAFEVHCVQKVLTSIKYLHGQVVSLAIFPLFIHYYNIVKVPNTSPPLLAIYFWTGKVEGNYWFGDHRSPEASRLFSKNINERMSNAERYYDEMANHYEEIVRNWGYNMPETMVYNLAKYANLSKNKPFAILDLGCGDGLCGHVLKV